MELHNRLLTNDMSLLQAIKLKDGFMELYKGKGAPGLTADKLKGAGIGWTDIFEEIPVSVQNSNLVCALMAQVRQRHVAASGHICRR
jgi:C-terminal region of eIF3h